MAESLAALGVAANIVQFLELGLKAAVSIIEIYRSVNDDGWTARHVNLDVMAKDLRARCDRLKEDADVKLDPAMSRLLQRCIDTADELTLELWGLAGGKATRNQKWEKFKISLAAYFKRGKINEIQARLVEIKTHVFEQLQILLYNNRLSLSRSMRSLEDASEGWHRATEKTLNTLAQDLSNLCESQSAAAASTEGLRIFSETWERVSEEAKNQATVVAILTSLRFTQIKERQSEIPRAHRRTFEWVFRDDSPVDLSTWLSSSSGLFWITGKPGSGKSTLMKFVLGHERTMLLAEQWASPEPLVVASHFFWSAGTAIQKSQEGLLRTLLFQILVNCPAIVPLVCPTRYSNAFKRLESWSIEELSDVFVRLKDIRPLPSRILLLIDGLDEYNGNLGDLVQFLRSTSESPYLKVCCASRSWHVFLHGFESVSGRIHIHKLTANDMTRYIRDTLGQHSYFQTLQQSQETEADKLVQDIADKSEGVFFWVSLVVKSLLRGLDNNDDLGILQQRLAEFPSDLDHFFQRMLDSIDTVYRDNVSMVFSMLLLANSSLPLVVFVELERLVVALNGFEARLKMTDISLRRSKNPDNESRIPIVSRFFQEEARKFSANMEHYWPSAAQSSTELVSRKKQQILAQCRDLIQAWEVEGDYEPHFNLRLGFLHRTVVEFLERAANAQWQASLPSKRYMLARSYLTFISVDGKFQWRTRGFLLRFLYTLQGADLQKMVEFHHWTGELIDGLLRCLGSDAIFFGPRETEELKLLLTQARARIAAAVKLEARQFFEVSINPPYHSSTRMGGLPWCLRGSGHVEVSDWAEIVWTRVVDLEVLDALLGHHSAVFNLHREYPAAFSRFLAKLLTESETRPTNGLLVCKTLIEHGFAGSVKSSRQAATRGMNPVQVLSEGASDSALTQSCVIEWLRLNRIFSEGGLRELEEAFPLETASVPGFIQGKNERGRKAVFSRRKESIS